MKPQVPTEVTSRTPHVLLPVLPPVPQFLASVSWAPFLEKLLALKFLSQGQLLGQSKPIHSAKMSLIDRSM